VKALILQRPGVAEVVEVERPEIAPDEILVASRVVGVCTVMVASGAFPVERPHHARADGRRVRQLIDPEGDQIKILVETK
jgi:NADPH:quinone reductase-like Zn-dependent oxidoreductase